MCIAWFLSGLFLGGTFGCLLLATVMAGKQEDEKNDWAKF